MLLLTYMTHNIFISLEENGFTLRLVWELATSEAMTRIDNYQTITALLIMPVFTCFSYWIEILGSYPNFPRKVLGFLIITNLIGVLVFPIYFSFYIESSYGIGAYFILYCTTTCLKLISFHHTYHDVRGLIRRV